MKCPLCDYEGKFGPITEFGARESMICPQCGASSRHRAVARAVSIATPGPIKRCIYEVGCSPLSPYIAQRHNLTVSELRPRHGAIAQDIEHLSFDDMSFDIVICSDVLEHVRLYRNALRELMRVLRPGGALILTVPSAPSPERHVGFCLIKDPNDPSRDCWVNGAPVHADPLDPAGCRVYRTFGSARLIAELGALSLSAHLEPADIPEFGIVNSAAFIAYRSL